MAAQGTCLNHLSRESSDIKRLAQFYIEIFGFEKVEAPRFEFDVIWLKLTPSFYLHLIERDPTTKLPEGPWSATSAVADPKNLPRGHHVCFSVSNFDSLVQNLKVRIRFKQKGYDFVEGRLPNLGQVNYVSEYQNHCVDVLSSFCESNILFPGYAYAHPQWSNITHSLLPEYHGEQTECKSNTNACKVIDELSDRYKDANPLGTSNKPNELSIPPNDLEKGIEVHERTQPDGKTKQVFFFDPDGNGLEVSSGAPAS